RGGRCGVRAVEPARARREHPVQRDPVHHGRGPGGRAFGGPLVTPLVARIDWVGWILLVARVAAIFFAMLISVVLVIWMERKVVADMQLRPGPNRAGPFGLLITLAD